MLQMTLTKAQKEISQLDRNIWIQDYVSRRENPVILILFSALLAAGSYFSFQRYFTEGSTYSFWIHLIAPIAMLIVMGIIHSILKRIFTKSAQRRCPVTAKPFDESEVPDADALLAQYKEIQNLPDKGFDMAKFMLLPQIILVLCFGYFAWLQHLPIPGGCIFYLIVMCVLFFFVYAIMVVSCTQAISLPVSQDVKDGFAAYEKEIAQQAEELRQEQERLEQQKALAAQEAANKAKRAEEANEMYLQAVAQNTVNDELLYQAAQMGSLDACRHVGHLLLERMASSMYTESEKAEYAKAAAGCLRTAAGSGDGELRYLWYFARYSYESNTLEGWQEMLDGLRQLMASGTLPPQYETDCTGVMQGLVRQINKMEAKRARPRHYRCHYCANGICTLQSDSVTLINCNYGKHPESCPSTRYRDCLETIYDD